VDQDAAATDVRGDEAGDVVEVFVQIMPMGLAVVWPDALALAVGEIDV